MGSFSTRVTDVPRTPTKGETMWMGGKMYRWGFTYEATVTKFSDGEPHGIGRETVVGTLSWSANAYPVPYLYREAKFEGEPDWSRSVQIGSWNSLKLVGET